MNKEDYKTHNKMKAKFTIELIDSGSFEDWEKEQAIEEIKMLEEISSKLYKKVIELQEKLLIEELK